MYQVPNRNKLAIGCRNTNQSKTELSALALICFSVRTHVILLLSISVIFFLCLKTPVNTKAKYFDEEIDIDLIGQYHDTLIVDHILPEDFHKGEDELDPLKGRYVLAERLYSLIVKSRNEWINSHYKNMTVRVPTVDWKSGMHIWNYFPPAFNCPFPVERIGRLGHGGKWICGLTLYESSPRPQECVIYLFGGGNDEELTNELVRRTDCQLLSFEVDKLKFLLNHSRNRIFDQVKIWDVNEETNRKTLETIMKENGHGFIDILIMDIQGRELIVLEQIMEEYDEVLPFGQLLVEIHIPPENDKNTSMFSRFKNWFERLERKGLRPFHSEANFLSGYYEGTENSKGPAFLGAHSYLKMDYSFLNLRGKHLLLTGKSVY